MTYTLYLGNKSYSSWSLRAWLIFTKFAIPFEEKFVDFGKSAGAEQLTHLVHPRTVPTMITPDGALVTESLAIAEELSTLHANLNLWPSDPVCRGVARSITAEMHAGFSGLRNEHPMNLRTGFADVQPSDRVRRELERLEQLWNWARQSAVDSGPWLFGEFTIADAFFAPVAARIAGYGLRVSSTSQTYIETHLTDDDFRRWREIGQSQGRDLKRYAQPWKQVPWPFD